MKRSKEMNNGLIMFRKEYYQKNKVKATGRNLKEQNEEVLRAWRALTEEQRNKYRDTADRTRPPRRRTRQVHKFHTRCSLPQLMSLAEFVNENEDLKTRVEAIGFGKLLKVEWIRLPRDLILALLQAYDPPTNRLRIRGKTKEINVNDVSQLLGLPASGNEVNMDAEEGDASFKEMKARFFRVPYTRIVKDLIDGVYTDEDFEFIFVLLTVGTFLAPTASPSVSNRLLRVMWCTKNDLGGFNWAKYVMEDLFKEMGDYIKFCSKKRTGACNVGGCLYLLLVCSF